MSFIRAKEIPPHSGNWYDYEVETVHQGGKVIQRHIRYIGKSGTVAHPVLTGNAGLRLRSMPDSPMPTNRISLVKHSYFGIACKHCQSQKVVKFGTENGTQYYWCKDCQRKFANNNALPRMKISADKIASAMNMYYSGMSFDGLQNQFKQDYDLDLSETTFWNWVKRFTKEAIKQSKSFKPVVGDRWIADETYMKLKDKTVYFWDIIDARTNYLLASHVSFNRGAKDAKELIKLAKERAGKAPNAVVTDKLASYISGIEDAYGSETKHVQGGPFKLISSGQSTAEIERFHRTLEQRTKVFQKYKDIRSIKLLTDGWLVYYDFFKQNEGVGDIPPAQVMSKVVPFKDWKDIVRDKRLKPESNYKVTLHPRPATERQKDEFIIPTIDVTLKLVEGK
jgi:putative transposase